MYQPAAIYIDSPLHSPSLSISIFSDLSHLFNMCKPSVCDTCSGKTWFGCGLHIPSVLDSVPKEEWCKCPKPEGSQYPPKGSVPAVWK
ncbi:hypothetical protein V1521DRAFT_422830 [Lipomyces starkeyi]